MAFINPDIPQLGELTASALGGLIWASHVEVRRLLGIQKERVDLSSTIDGFTWIGIWTTVMPFYWMLFAES